MPFAPTLAFGLPHPCDPGQHTAAIGTVAQQKVLAAICLDRAGQLPNLAGSCD